jgi:Domain of unknown function (DUF4918)
VLADRILRFLKGLEIQARLPKGVGVLSPYQDKTSFQLCEKFYRKFYSDDRTRTLIIGINPGRLGGGLTGIPFTDPLKLQERCGIPNELPKRAELSADFIHLIIDAFGGLEKFYGQFYFSSVSPLGFTRDGKNLNYYDIPELQKVIKPFIVASMRQQLAFGLLSETCFVLGEGKNFDYVQSLNAELSFFKTVVPLPHPRFVMQYKRKKLKEYIALYQERLQTLGL